MTIAKTNQDKINKLDGFLSHLSEKWWGMLLLSFIPFLIILAPLLFAKKVFLRGDLVNWVYPIYQFYKTSLISGQSIFWNPDNMSGFPSFVSSMGFLSPLHFLLFKFLPLFTAYNLIIFLNCGLALFFTWRLLLKFKLSSAAGFFGGLIYVFSQWSWIHDITVCNALPILPLFFLIIYELWEKKNNWLVLGGDLLIGWAWLSVHFNWLVMILSAGFLFTLFLGWRSKKKKWLIIIEFLIIVLIGTAIGLLILKPALVYGSLSARAEGLSYDRATRGALNIGDFVRFFLPYFKVSVFNLANSGGQLYLGILPLFFIIFAFVFKSPLNRFFTFLFFLCLLLSIKYSPLLLLLHQLPGFSSLRGPHRWMFIGSFAGAILAGFGLDQFLTAEKDRYKKILINIFKWLGWLILAISALATFLFYLFKDKIILLSQNYFDKYLYQKTSGLSLTYYHSVIEKLLSEIRELFSLFNPQVFLPIIFLLIAPLLLLFFYRRKTGKNFTQLVILVVLLNFFCVFAFYHPIISAKEFYLEPATAKFIKEDLKNINPIEGRRVFTFLPGFSEYTELTIPYQPDEFASLNFQKELLGPNLNLFYGFDSADSYDNMMPRRMSRILALIGSDRATMGDKLSDLKALPEEKVEKLEQRKKLLDLLGIRYILSVFPLNEKTFPQLLRIDISPYNIPLSVYENREVRPLFYFAGRTELIKPDEEAAYQKLLKDPLEGRNIFIECSDCVIKSGFNSQGEIFLEEKNNNLVRLKVNSPIDNYLIFSENYLPGWRAFIDGQETEIYYANSVYMGIFMPVGEHEILFRYSPY